MRLLRVLALLAAVLAAVPAPARADGYIAPFIGANFGGDIGQPLNVSLKDRNRLTYGATLGFMGGGVFGVELDFSYTNNFYPTTITPEGSNHLWTLMPALVIGVPLGGQKGFGVRPFALAGVGLVKRDADFGSLSSIAKNDLAYALGGGVMVFFNDHIGVRGEYRYTRNFSVDDLNIANIDLERGTFNYSRATGAVVFRF
jgi:opacity protein-like surface antigen